MTILIIFLIYLEFDSFNNIHPKFTNIYNSAYVDSFFSYLSSQLLNNYNFLKWY